MNQKVLNYAKSNIDESENGIKVFISQGNLYIETICGRNFKIAEDEVKYQATEYLKSEINNINQY